jgi:hypothetical protein
MKTTTKKDRTNEVMLLRYRIGRYQAMRNGTMCQKLTGMLNKLLNKQQLATT